MFFLGGLPALLSLFIRAKVKESDAWHEHKTDWASYRRSLPKHWRRFVYLVLLMTMMNFMSHGTQDMYPTLLGSVGYAKTRIADITMLAGIGAILGGLVFGYYSDRAGRRKAMMIAMVCGLVVVPFWIAGHSPWRILVGVFLMQFFVQGAWGVIPAHINELSPNHLRGFFPGLRLPAGRDVRRQHSVRRVGARREIQLHAGDGRAGGGRVRRRVHRDAARARSQGRQLQKGGMAEGLRLRQP